MKRWISLILIFILVACSTIKYVPTNSNTNIKDSVVVNVIDSIRIIPVEVVKDIVPQYDTLHLETSLAKSIAYVDTTNHILRGSIENKNDIVYRIKYKDRIVYKDSISVKEVPIPVDKIVYKHYWYEKYLIIFSILCLIGICIKLFIK